MLPTGQRGRVVAHRAYRTPRGALTFNPVIANVTTRYVKKWVPAYFDRPAIGSRGAWVQLSQGDRSIGVLNTPGMPARQVTVLGVEGDHALVRHRAAAGLTNPARARSVVSTRSRRRTRRGRVLAPAGGGGAGRIDWCKWFPKGKKCEQEIASACPPGTEWNGYHCAPSGNPGCPAGQVQCGKGILSACCVNCDDPMCGASSLAAPSSGRSGRGGMARKKKCPKGQVPTDDGKGCKWPPIKLPEDTGNPLGRPKPNCPPGTHRCGSFCCKNLRSSGSSGIRSRRSRRVSYNPVSPAEDRYQATVGRGNATLGQTLRALGSGEARLVIDRSGISVRNPDFPGSCNRNA